MRVFHRNKINQLEKIVFKESDDVDNINVLLLF